MSDGLNREGFTAPQAAQPLDLPAMTPGQAACVAWNERFGEQFGIIAAEEWALGDPRGRVAWEAAAIAGHNAFAAQPKPAPELAAAMGETKAMRTLVAEILESYEATDARGPATRVQIAKWRKRAGLENT